MGEETAFLCCWAFMQLGTAAVAAAVRKEEGVGDLRGLSVLLVGEEAARGRDRLAGQVCDILKVGAAAWWCSSCSVGVGGDQLLAAAWGEGQADRLRKLSLEAFLRQFLTREDWGLCSSCSCAAAAAAGGDGVDGVNS